MNRRAICCALFVLLAGTALLAQQATGPQVAARNDAGKGTDKIAALNAKAAIITDQYAKLERMLLRMAELETITNPQRAALLKRAVRQSGERRTKKRLENATEFLVPPGKLQEAVSEQAQALADMKSLLELLLSEERADRLKAEEKRIREYIKEVERLIRLQRSAEGRTRGGAEAQRMADEQDRIANRTGNLVDDIRENEEGASQDKPDKSEQGERQEGGTGDEKSQNKPSESGSEDSGKQEPKEGDDSAGSKDGGKPKDGDQSQQGDKPKSGDEPKDGKTPDGDNSKEDENPAGDMPKAGDAKTGDPKSGDEDKPGQRSEKGEPNKGQPGQPQEGQTQEGQQSDGQPSNQQQQPQQEEDANPARKRLQAAEERMREAQRRLEEAKREQAVEQQEQARQELEKAKAELEEILRQLREEEIGRTLAMLEVRFRRMLEKQIDIYESTKRLDKIEPEKRGRQVDIQANKLGFDETKLAVEADKALLLLLEEGSSIAFPETVQMMRDDMTLVADRLSSAKIGLTTQGMQEEIISALEEMIEALQQAQREQEEEQQRQQQRVQKQGQPGDKPLVDKIAELKMIRALQMRVNSRTARYAQRLEDTDDPVGQAEDEELRGFIERLSERQERIHGVTQDIVQGKNQ